KAIRFLAPLLLAWPAGAVEKAFQVMPPDKVAFNYPAPPHEAGSGFFPIADKGEARCVIVQPATASPAAQAAVRALQAYLGLATGARFTVIGDDKPVPEGMASIHVGDTVVGKTTDLHLPELRYGDEGFPNLSGYLIKTLDR